MAFLSAEQKKTLGPFLIVAQVVLALVAGHFMYTLAGGEPLGLLGDVTPWVLGAIVGYIAFRQLQK